MKLALALTMAATAMNLVAAKGDGVVMTPYTIVDDGTVTLLIGYADEKGHQNIMDETEKKKQKGVKITETNHAFNGGARPLKVKGAKTRKEERMLKKGKKGREESTPTISGFSAIRVPKSNAKAEIDSFNSIPGVVSVELDATYTIQTLRGASAEEHVKDIQEAIKTASDQIEDVANHGRRLAEETPWGIDMVESKYVNLKPSPDGAEPIKICVVDTGYANGHNDLPTIAEHGVDGFKPSSYSSGSWDVDGHGHGTHCAGTIGAIGGNDNGVTSVNPDPSKFKFFIGKGLTDSGSGTGAGVLEAVGACVENGAKVVSLSLGGGGYSANTEAAYAAYYDDNVLFIAAAGNGGSSSYLYPASYPALVSIAAINVNKAKASFSQFNDQVELAAPGVGVKSTLPNNNYASWSGTSMATPHVAGVAALLWYHFPECTNNQIRSVMIASSEDLGADGWDSGFGWGLVNATAAYDLLAAQGCAAGGPDPRPAGKLSDQAEGGKNQQWEFGPTPPPSPAPTSFCAGSFVSLKVDIVTDNYPSETTWTVTNECDQVEVMSGGPYNQQGTPYAEEELVCGSHKFKFTINDTFGDGICCSYGTGSYEVHFNGDKVAQGGAFGDAETKFIGEDDACDATAPPTTASPTTASPTTAPTPPPTTASPTTAPTPPPVTASTNKFVCAKDEPTSVDICVVGSKCEEDICPYCLDTCWVKSCDTDNDNVQEAS